MAAEEGARGGRGPPWVPWWCFLEGEGAIWLADVVVEAGGAGGGEDLTPPLALSLSLAGSRPRPRSPRARPRSARRFLRCRPTAPPGTPRGLYAGGIRDVAAHIWTDKAEPRPRRHNGSSAQWNVGESRKRGRRERGRGTGDRARGTGNPAPAKGDRAPDTGQRGPGTGHPAPGKGDRAPDAGQRGPVTGHAAPGKGYGVPGVLHRAMGTGDRASRTG